MLIAETLDCRNYEIVYDQQKWMNCFGSKSLWNTWYIRLLKQFKVVGICFSLLLLFIFIWYEECFHMTLFQSKIGNIWVENKTWNIQKLFSIETGRENNLSDINFVQLSHDQWSCFSIGIGIFLHSSWNTLPDLHKIHSVAK